jgi:probable dihydroxyacetone kinase regulator
MSKPELTKSLIAQTLRDLMKSTSLDKISVQDIVAASGLNRKTFYYHFQDKQALICWIFDSEFASITDLNNNGTIIEELIAHLYENKDFYVAALTSDVQNNLTEHLFKIAYHAIIMKIMKILGTREMAPENMRLIANYFSNAIIGTLTQWAKAGMVYTPDEHSANLFPITEECLEFIVNKHVKD